MLVAEVGPCRHRLSHLPVLAGNLDQVVMNDHPQGVVVKGDLAAALPHCCPSFPPRGRCRRPADRGGFPSRSPARLPRFTAQIRRCRGSSSLSFFSDSGTPTAFDTEAQGNALGTPDPRIPNPNGVLYDHGPYRMSAAKPSVLPGGKAKDPRTSSGASDGGWRASERRCGGPWPCLRGGSTAGREVPARRRRRYESRRVRRSRRESRPGADALDAFAAYLRLVSTRSVFLSRIFTGCRWAFRFDRVLGGGVNGRFDRIGCREEVSTGISI